MEDIMKIIKFLEESGLLINIQKITTGQRDNCITGCLLDYPYFENDRCRCK